MKKRLVATFCVFLILLSACEKEDNPDLSPDLYYFGNIENAQVKTFYFSDTITITGISHPSSIQLDYTTYGEEYVGEIYINGSQVTVEASSEVAPGDEIYLKVQSSELYATSVTTTISIGDQRDSFTVTTQSLPFQKTNYPGKFFYDLKTFTIGNKVYMGLGGNLEENVEIKELYEFDISENSWTQKAGYQGSTDFSYFFSVAEKGYMGYENAIVEYNPAADSWKRIEGISLGEGISSQSIFEANGEIRALVDYNDLTSRAWKFDATNLSWIPNEEVDNSVENKYLLFVLEGKPYFGVRDKAELWMYDVLTNTWVAKNLLPKEELATGISLHGKGYLLYRTVEGIVIYKYNHQLDEFMKVGTMYSYGEQNPPDAMPDRVTVEERAFIITAYYSGVIGSVDLAEFVIYEANRR